jgi:hypothetical protein
MNELIRKTITGLRINDDQSLLAFVHPDGTITSYATEGDCCSETWFADITGVHYLLGCTVKEVEFVDLPNIEDGRTRQDSDEFYGVNLTTDKGHTNIVYRNSSNGYYGGSIKLNTKALPEGMTSIIDDWQA